MNTRIYDVAVVGGGAAGLSAALVLGRARRQVVVIDAGTPRNAPAAHMQGFLSRDGMPPVELLAVGRAEVAGYGVEVIDGQVVAVDAGFVLRLASGRTLRARRVLVATGMLDGLPAIPGVRERWGRDLLHCPYCHGWEVRGQAIGVLRYPPGCCGPRPARAPVVDDVVFFSHVDGLLAGERVRLEARGIRVVSGEVASIVVEDDRLSGVELVDGQVIARAVVFVRPAETPPTLTACWRVLAAKSSTPASLEAMLLAGRVPSASGSRVTSSIRVRR